MIKYTDLIQTLAKQSLTLDVPQDTQVSVTGVNLVAYIYGVTVQKFYSDLNTHIVAYRATENNSN